MADLPKFASAITTRSTGVKGTVLCGNQPADDVKIRLYRIHTDDPYELLDYKTSSAINGKFELEGHTAGRNETVIEPFVRFYHRCDLNEKKKGFRTFGMKFSKEFVTVGRFSRRPYDVGTINLEVIYPKEKHVKEFQEQPVPTFDTFA
ncbi:Transthyretin-like protein 46 [Toxocara canis]|uniref:Transthyretin-like protein 46 n=1 Tax=Toxocara canis TaxID=6265 RepID=A0A0B2VJP1_TOXCA|nr:Transthyretin-like protein 46 [Toxocara canis]